MSTVADAPARGTRPPNRHALIVGAAGRLFAERGFSNVAMSDIADALNVRPSALYRHVRGKSELLLEATETALLPFVDAAAAPRPDAVIDALVAAILADRTAGLLWMREARHLDDAGQHRVADAIDGIATGIAATLDMPAEDADLVARAMVSVLASVSLHRFEVPAALLVGMLARIAAVRPLGHGPAITVKAAQAVSRRDDLLAQAVELFGRRGYALVGVDDIAAAAGIAGPSFYNHFASKYDLLAEAFTQGHALLRAGVAEARDDSTLPGATLERLVDSYIRIVVEHQALFVIVVVDLHELERDEQKRAGVVHNEILDTWASAVQAASGCGSHEARVRSEAVLLLTVDMIRSERLGHRPGLVADLRRMALSLLH